MSKRRTISPQMIVWIALLAISAVGFFYMSGGLAGLQSTTGDRAASTVYGGRSQP